MDSFSSYLRKAEEMLQAVDDSVAKHMKSESAIGSLSLATSLSGGGQRLGEGGIDGGPSTSVDGREVMVTNARARAYRDEGGSGDVGKRQAVPAGGEEGGDGGDAEPISSTSTARIGRLASSNSTHVELMEKKKRLEERRLELKEKKKKRQQRAQEGGATLVTPPAADVVEHGLQTTEEKGEGDLNEDRKLPSSQLEEAQPRQPDSQPQRPTAVQYDEELDINRLVRLLEALRKKNKALNKEVLHLEDELTQVETKNKELEESAAKLQDLLKSTRSEANTSEERAAALEIRLQGAISSIESNEEIIRGLRQALESKERESATMTAERNVSETQLLASLRKDVDAAELLAESERRAHAQSRKTFEARETQLEESMARAAAALADSQVKLDEYVGKLAESQSRCTELEVQVLEARKSAPPRSRSPPPNSTEDRARARELELELGSALKDAANAKNELNALQHDVALLRDENETLKQRVTKFESSDVTSLQRRLNELTSALYSKQAQIENLSAEKNALMMQSQSDGVRRRSAAVDKLFSGAEEGENVVPMRSLRAVDKLAGWKAAEQWVEKLARLLDAIAMQAVALIRLSPVFRLGFFAYLLGMHMFIYVMLYSWGTSTHAPRSGLEAQGGGV